MTNTQSDIHQRSINNAISAYLMIFISGSFLLNKDNIYLNNPFVKSHTKVAFIIHLGFLVNYIIFITFSFLKNLSIFGYTLNYIIASSIFTILFIALLYGIYKANKAHAFKIGDLFSIGRKEKIIDINGDNKLDEKDKLTLILSYIPFIGYIVNGLYYHNPIVKSIVFFNLLISITLSVIYIFGYTNIALLFLLFYIVFSVFSSINIISNNTVIDLKLDFIPHPEEKISILISFYKYIKNYFSDKEFVGIQNVQSKEKEKRKEEESFNNDILEEKKNYSLPKVLIYFPIVNIISLVFLNSKMRFHIINGMITTLLIILSLGLNYFHLLSFKFNILFLFPIFFGIGYSFTRPAYKMPFIYEVFEIAVKIKEIFKKSKKTLKKKQSEVHEEVLQVGENLHSDKADKKETKD